ncbi:hypothetical protein C8Q74DRAFT_1218979 [Fomes fomentarius]|nr:hypothetical protein C8Q74DRAFT_1218979 [Fomes fomentarius]
MSTDHLYGILTLEKVIPAWEYLTIVLNQMTAQHNCRRAQYVCLRSQQPFSKGCTGESRYSPRVPAHASVLIAPTSYPERDSAEVPPPHPQYTPHLHPHIGTPGTMNKNHTPRTRIRTGQPNVEHPQVQPTLRPADGRGNMLGLRPREFLARVHATSISGLVTLRVERMVWLTPDVTFRSTSPRFIFGRFQVRATRAQSMNRNRTEQAPGISPPVPSFQVGESRARRCAWNRAVRTQRKHQMTPRQYDLL